MYYRKKSDRVTVCEVRNLKTSVFIPKSYSFFRGPHEEAKASLHIFPWIQLKEGSSSSSSRSYGCSMMFSLVRWVLCC